MTEHHVLGISGGKDSAALAVYMSLNHPELDIDYFFTDTGKELPEVYEFLGRLEGLLGKEITRLNPHRGFDYWLKSFHNFLPSPQTRWCTRGLQLCSHSSRRRAPNRDAGCAPAPARCNAFKRSRHRQSRSLRSSGFCRSGASCLLRLALAIWMHFLLFPAENRMGASLGAPSRKLL